MYKHIKIINKKELEIIKRFNSLTFPNRIQINPQNKAIAIEISDESIKYIRSQVALSIKIGVIKPQDTKIATAGLLSAGFESTINANTNEIRPMHIKKGWARSKKGFGNCPPAECLFRTVISRKKEFGEDNPSFNDIIEIL